MGSLPLTGASALSSPVQETFPQPPADHAIIYVADDKNMLAPLPFEKGGARRVTAMAQKRLKGFAIDSEEIIKPNYRVLAREGHVQFMEVRPREPLMLGEYAIIGTDLGRIATFRVARSPNR